MSDIPSPVFVNPNEVATTYRFALYAASGEGKTVAACSAPRPLLAVNADRPSAFAFARKFHKLSPSDLREMRYEDETTLDSAYAYLRNEGQDVRTVIVDPLGNIYDALRLSGKFVRRDDGEIDYDAVNSKVIGFIRALRKLDVNVVLVGHEKINDSGKKKDGKVYPAFGGPTLINKVLAEMDVVAHVERYQRRDPESGDLGEVQWIGQIAPIDNFVGKGYGNLLGDRRVLNLSRWVELLNEDFKPDTSDLPWDGASAPAEGAPVGNGTTPTLPAADATPPEPIPLPAGEAPIDEALAASQRLATSGELTTVEMALLLDEGDWQLLDKLIEGHTAASAAEALDSSPAAVRAHVEAIKRVLGQSSIVPIVKLAKEMRVEEGVA